MPPFDLNDKIWKIYLKNQTLINNIPDKEDMVMSKYIPILKGILESSRIS